MQILCLDIFPSVGGESVEFSINICVDWALTHSTADVISTRWDSRTPVAGKAVLTLSLIKNYGLVFGGIEVSGVLRVLSLLS